MSTITSMIITKDNKIFAILSCMKRRIYICMHMCVIPVIMLSLCVLASFVQSTFPTYIVHGFSWKFVTKVAQILYDNSIKAEDIVDLMVAYI
uniref:Uncharacterized protein n=1 Tax=Glossina palpalis gambiensis TaxID=67801 RepID=A0A1B0C018_9MUSC